MQEELLCLHPRLYLRGFVIVQICCIAESDVKITVVYFFFLAVFFGISIPKFLCLLDKIFFLVSECMMELSLSLIK